MHGLLTPDKSKASWKASEKAWCCPSCDAELAYENIIEDVFINPILMFYGVQQSAFYGQMKVQIWTGYRKEADGYYKVPINIRTNLNRAERQAERLRVKNEKQQQSDAYKNGTDEFRAEVDNLKAAGNWQEPKERSGPRVVSHTEIVWLCEVPNGVIKVICHSCGNRVKINYAGG
jgi:hypothetical protein